MSASAIMEDILETILDISSEGIDDMIDTNISRHEGTINLVTDKDDFRGILLEFSNYWDEYSNSQMGFSKSESFYLVIVKTEISLLIYQVNYRFNGMRDIIIDNDHYTTQEDTITVMLNRDGIFQPRESFILFEDIKYVLSLKFDEGNGGVNLSGRYSSSELFNNLTKFDLLKFILSAKSLEEEFVGINLINDKEFLSSEEFVSQFLEQRNLNSIREGNIPIKPRGEPRVDIDLVDSGTGIDEGKPKRGLFLF